ncbi:MAG: hypothetical protein ACFFE1_02060 [Candidatus Thorarchaeota archaeon]
MADEEQIRVETPDEDEVAEERKGLLRPLPSAEEPKYSKGKERPQPIVRVLGISMREKRKDLLMLILIPAMVALIDTTIYSFVVTASVESSALFLFFLPAIIAIPIGLTSSEAGSALIGGFLGAIFFLIFIITFLASPAIIVPHLGLGNFIVSGFAISLAYFILMTLATVLGSVIGIIIREFF